jgi:uncharacterized membrane protein YfbV (UPF0208 family)
MKTIKKSQLKEIFKGFGLSEGIFDLFSSRKTKLKNRLQNDLNNIKKKIEDTINSAPNQEEKDQLRKLANAFDKAYNLGK